MGFLISKSTEGKYWNKLATHYNRLKNGCNQLQLQSLSSCTFLERIADSRVKVTFKPNLKGHFRLFHISSKSWTDLNLTPLSHWNLQVWDFLTRVSLPLGIVPLPAVEGLTFRWQGHGFFVSLLECGTRHLNCKYPTYLLPCYFLTGRSATRHKRLHDHAHCFTLKLPQQVGSGVVGNSWKTHK